MDSEYGAMMAGLSMNRSGSAIGSTSMPVGAEPKLRERLYEIDKLLTDSTASIRDSADRLFGQQILTGNSLAKDVNPAEPSLAQVIDRILEMARSNREEAMRLNRIG